MSSLPLIAKPEESRPELAPTVKLDLDWFKFLTAKRSEPWPPYRITPARLRWRQSPAERLRNRLLDQLDRKRKG